MKFTVALLATLISVSSFASSKFVYSAECVSKDESKSFDVLLDQASDNFDSIKEGLQVVVEEGTKRTGGILINIGQNDVLEIALDDGRTLKFAQNGGYNTTLNNTRFMCSNALGF